MRRRAGIAGIAGMVTFAACTGTLVGPDVATDRYALFEQVWREVDRHYSFFVLKSVNWDSLHRVYAPRAAAAPTDRALSDVLGEMLAELRDLHVNLFTPGRSYRYTGHDLRPAHFDPVLVRAAYVVDRRTTPRRTMQYGHIAPDLGYIWIPGFGGSGFGEELDTALARLRGVAGLIIDVRDNQGGNNQNSLDVASRFADRERIISWAVFRSGPRHDDFTPPRPRQVRPAGPHRFDRPVVVVTNRLCASSTEDFVLAMRGIPSVTVVGDSTAGAAGIPLTRELPNGWTYRFSQSIEFTADRQPYEGIGLAPDVWVQGSREALVAGKDEILDSALSIIRRAP